MSISADNEATTSLTVSPAAAPSVGPRASVRDLHVTFQRRGVPLHAVRGVSLDIYPGEVLALVGESGSGKSVTGLALLGLLAGEPAPVISGRAEVCGTDMVTASADERRRVRKVHLGAVFQDPMTSLNPVFSLGQQIEEVLVLHQKLSPRAAREQALELLKRVGIPSPERRILQYPHELSGGMKQRVMIAIAIACRPKLLIADEPTTALDVTIQAQIMALLKSLQQELGMAVLLITHDLGVVAHAAERVDVMYAGKIVEHGSVRDIFKRPAHPYTQALLAALPHPLSPAKRLEAIPGRVPAPSMLPAGCAFCARCKHAFDPCSTEQPPLLEVSPPHVAACWLHDPKRASAVG